MKTNDINRFINFTIEAYNFDDSGFYEDFGLLKDDFLNEKIKMIKRLKLKAVAQSNKNKNERLLEFAVRKIQTIIDSADAELKGRLAQLIHSRSPKFQFRNLEKLERSDLKEVLSDLNIIEIIEELEESDNGNK